MRIYGLTLNYIRILVFLYKIIPRYTHLVEIMKLFYHTDR